MYVGKFRAHSTLKHTILPLYLPLPNKFEGVFDRKNISIIVYIQNKVEELKKVKKNKQSYFVSFWPPSSKYELIFSKFALKKREIASIMFLTKFKNQLGKKSKKI